MVINCLSYRTLLGVRTEEKENESKLLFRRYVVALVTTVSPRPLLFLAVNTKKSFVVVVTAFKFSFDEIELKLSIRVLTEQDFRSR